MNSFSLRCIIVFVLIIMFLGNCSKKEDKLQVNNQILESQKVNTNKQENISEKKSESIVTFIELGSVNCIPCRMMQPIMREIEEEYEDEVKVVFYDVWTNEGRPYALKYKIRAIPTQVFLDKDDKEFFRHEGFFPKEEIVNILKSRGIN